MTPRLPPSNTSPVRVALELFGFAAGFIVSGATLVYCCCHPLHDLGDLGIPLTLASMGGAMVCGDGCHSRWTWFERDRRIP